MIISHSKKFIYLKPTKVAGTSTELFFKQFCDRDTDIAEWGDSPKSTIWNSHKSASEIKQTLINKNIWNDYAKIGNIRNPWDRIVSSYCFNNHSQQAYSWAFPSFEEFVQALGPKKSPNSWRRRGPMSFYEFYSIDKFKEYYKNDMYFIRYENLYQDILNVCKMLKLKPTKRWTLNNLAGMADGQIVNGKRLLHKFKSNRNTDYKTYYNEETKQIIEKKYEYDIELLNYTY